LFSVNGRITFGNKTNPTEPEFPESDKLRKLRSVSTPIMDEGKYSFNSYVISNDDFDLTKKNTYYNDSYLQTIDIQDLRTIFENVPFITNDYINIMNNNPTINLLPSNMQLSFEFDEELTELTQNYSNILIRFTNIPVGIKILCSVVNGINQSTHDINIVRRQHPDYTAEWLECRNTQHIMASDKYDSLDINLKNMYSKENTDQNAFQVDFVFNELLKHDPNQTFITSSMRESFQELAFDTSINNGTI
jgi:hypothetical protein